MGKIKNLLTLILIATLTVFGVASMKALALPGTDASLISPMNPTMLSQEKHTYNVSFGNDGEAFVKARLVIGNDMLPDRESISLDFDNVRLQDPIFYQQILTTRCYQDTNSSCSNLADPDYYTQYFGEYNTKYELLTYSQENNKYKISLKEHIKTSSAGAIIVSFRTKDYTKEVKNNLYAINYKTPKYGKTVDGIVVNMAANVNKYYFRFTDLDVNKANGAVTTIKEPESGLRSNSSAALDDFANSIYYSPMATSEGANLLSGESLTVKGEYSRSILLLHRQSVCMLIGLSLMIVLFAIISIIVFMRKVKSDQTYRPIKDIVFYVKAFIIGFIALIKFTVGMAIFYLISNSIFNTISSSPYYFGSYDYSGWMILSRLIMILLLILLDIVTILFMSYIFRAKTRLMPLMALGSQLLYLPIVIIFVFIFLMRGI
jgi:hypothetical protein